MQNHQNEPTSKCVWWSCVPCKRSGRASSSTFSGTANGSGFHGMHRLNSCHRRQDFPTLPLQSGNVGLFRPPLAEDRFRYQVRSCIPYRYLSLHHPELIYGTTRGRFLAPQPHALSLKQGLNLAMFRPSPPLNHNSLIHLRLYPLSQRTSDRCHYIAHQSLSPYLSSTSWALLQEL